ncbi:MAG: ATP-binding cassette domain-containing protein [Eubacterium sp.]|nr:ATP-binding cassette domain-containing protein [Eubacterium sp.]
MLKLENVCFEADGNQILKDINLTIEDRFVAITGPNGSGKSTLMKLIMGLYEPTSGKIIFDGTDITHMPINERANLGISYAFQQPVRFKGLKVKDLMGLAGKEHMNLIEACGILSEVGLCAKDYQNRELNDTLSGGEMKRIEIAMTAARGSKLSLFDEPEAGIDLWSFQSLIRVFRKLYDMTSGTIVIISHQERILDISDKIVYLKDGEVVKYDTRENVIGDLQKGLLTNAGCGVLDGKYCDDNEQEG